MIKLYNLQARFYRRVIFRFEVRFWFQVWSRRSRLSAGDWFCKQIWTCRLWAVELWYCSDRCSFAQTSHSYPFAYSTQWWQPCRRWDLGGIWGCSRMLSVSQSCLPRLCDVGPWTWTCNQHNQVQTQTALADALTTIYWYRSLWCFSWTRGLTKAFISNGMLWAHAVYVGLC